MALRRRTGGGWSNISTIRRRAGAAWVGVQSVRRRQGGAWVTVWTSYTAPTVSAPAFASGEVFTPAPAPLSAQVYSNGITAVASGGTGSYTYAWEFVSGSSAISATVPSGESTQFTASISRNTSASAVFRCRVSDGVTTSYSNNVAVDLGYYSDN